MRGPLTDVSGCHVCGGDMYLIGTVIASVVWLEQVI